tara:strand:- start:6642 stop:7622 length:981 start_codon:yes stop_codon:yes gene_type:complete
LTKNRNININNLCSKLAEGNITALSKSITLIESTNNDDKQLAYKILNNLKTKKKSIRIGITGVPGVGKSTFIEVFGTYLSGMGKKLAVLTIDPSSSITKGSILGDKTRMSQLSINKNVFIRPTPSSSFQGGVGRNTKETIFLCEAAGYEIVIIETVGVGQNEISVSEIVDFFLLLKISGTGDELQGMKRGIIEMSDLIAINKCDGNNIENSIKSKTDFQLALKLFPPKKSKWIPRVLTCSSIKNEGIAEIWNCINDYIFLTKKNNYFFKNRLQQDKKWLLQIVDNSLRESFFKRKSLKSKLKKLIEELSKGKINVFDASEKILSEI